jgi:hypothetical protein
MDSFWKFATFTVAAVAVSIAYQQFSVAREKLKLDLFEKRFTVFTAARRFLSHILQHGGLLALDELGQYRADVAEATFLFDDDVTDFLAEIDRRALHLWTLHETFKGTEPGPTHATLAEEISQELEWLANQLVMLKPAFEPYMKFSSWRDTFWRRGAATADRWTRQAARFVVTDSTAEAIGRRWRRMRRRWRRWRGDA